MPTTYAHYKFGKEVLGVLPRPLQSSIENHRELFDAGLHGPDLLFYYQAIKKNPVSSQGFELHELPADEFFEHALQVIGASQDPAAARAYIYGFICHFALDSECHKYIEKMIQVSGISHSEIEMEFDRMLLKEDFINPVRYLATNHIHPTEKNAAVIAPFFQNLTADTVQKAMKSMIVCHKLMRAPGKTKRSLLFGGMKLIGQYDSLHGMVMSMEPNPECREYCLLLKKLFEGAVPVAQSLILQYQECLFRGETLSGRFHETFGAGDDWENLTL